MVILLVLLIVVYGLLLWELRTPKAKKMSCSERLDLQKKWESGYKNQMVTKEH